MIDPLVGLGALAIVLLAVPEPGLLDPGPHPECPPDMRLVEGEHHDVVQHYCVDPRPSQRDTHCYAYWDGITAAEGTVTNVRVCMDQFEAPNVRGAKPLVMQSYEMAKRWCGARGKRVCTEQEWELACEGGEHRPLAYGWAVDVSLCNSNKKWRAFDVTKLQSERKEVVRAEVERLWQGTPSGFFRTCVSRFGIYDMMGNVEEWVTTRKTRKRPGALMGGFWAKPWTGCRGTNDAHEPTFTFYETGFRCCAEPGKLPPDGKRGT